MNQPSAPNPQQPSGSALIIVLLMIVLLATIAVSFLSTARVEQIATRNFTRQTAARGLADLATGEAMAQIAEGLNPTNTNATTITISQPGRIRTYQFSADAAPAAFTNELFPANNSAGTNFNINTNGIVTGNPNGQIQVPWQQVTNTNGEVVGRVTYYVDDEGTKLNLNQAAGNRDTLNASGRRPLDIAALDGANVGVFSNIVSGNSTEPSDIESWLHFFRPEQAVGAGVVPTNLATQQVPQLSTAVSTVANHLASKTPWGTARLHINELPIDANSVNTIYEALTGGALNDIFQVNFGDKYTELGLNQTVANFLQMRLPDVRTPSDSFTYLGGLLGATNANTDFDDRIPSNYQARSFFPVISELALFAEAIHPYGDADPPNATWTDRRTRLVVTVVVEVDNPYDQDYPGGGWVEVLLDKASYTLKNGAHTWPNCGPQGEEAGDTWTNINTPGNLGESYYNSAIDENGVPLLNGTWNNFAAVTLPAIPKFSKKRFIFSCVHNINLTNEQKNYLAVNNLKLKDFEIKDPVDVKVKRIVLYAGAANVDGNGLGTEPDPLSIRDWVTGDEMEQEGFNKQIPVGDLYPNGNKVKNNTQKPTAQTFQRSDARIKRSRAMVTAGELASPWYFANQTMGETNTATPIKSKGDTIPGDPSPNNSPTEALWPNPATPNAMADPILLGGADQTNVSVASPADLGKVLTPHPWRTLRMQVQPASEAAANLIPDWAMLEVLSFGTTNTNNPAFQLSRFQPVNLNGQFHVPAGSPQPAARDIGIKSLVKVLDGTPNKLADPMGGPNITISEPKKFMGETQQGANDATTVATNIGSMTWSAASSWANRRTALGFPDDAYLLPSEIMEIKGVADSVSATDYNNAASHFKWNEGRASALLPAVTTRSSHFMVYAVAQSGREQDGEFQPQGESFTKTLVEVHQDPTNPALYKVEKLYTEPVAVE